MTACWLTLVAPSTFHSIGRTGVRALRRLVFGRPARYQQPCGRCTHPMDRCSTGRGVVVSYPQLRQANWSRRGSGQSRARCPTALQLTHFTSTRSIRERSSLQLRAICPISFIFPFRVSLARLIVPLGAGKESFAYHHSSNISGSGGRKGDRHLRDGPGSPQRTEANVRAELHAAACG